MSKLKLNKLVKEYAVMTAGVAAVAIATSVFFEPASLVTGGVTGLGIVLRDLFKDVADIPVWLTNAVLNIPLFIMAWKVKGFKFVSRTLYATVLLSPALYLASLIPTWSHDVLLCSIFGGALSGFGLGLVFRANATTGGSDLAAWIIHHFKRHVNVSQIMLVLDIAVILAGLLVFGAEKSMYAVIAAFVTSKAVSAVLEGLSYAKAAYIISDKSVEIGRKLLSDLERGVTSLSGKGLYTGDEKDVILCVVSTKEIVRLKDIAKEIDKDAFVIVSDVREVLGEGFGA